MWVNLYRSNDQYCFERGKDVHIVDMFAVPTWKTTKMDPLVDLPVSSCAILIFMYISAFNYKYVCLYSNNTKTT